MKLTNYVTHPVVQTVRAGISELSLGLGSAWVTLTCFELMRRGFVSLYVDLNWLLVVTLMTWFLGSAPIQRKTWQRYVLAAFFAILLSALAWRLSEGQPWHAYAAWLGCVALLSLIP
jgi:hypothetical protein